MAQLIKLRHPPAKWLLKKKLALTHANQLVSLFYQNQKNQHAAGIDNLMSSIKEVIKSFINEKDQYYEFGCQRSIRKYQSRLVVEALIYAADLMLNIQKEAVAIHTIAAEIARNITGSLQNLDDGPPVKNNIEKMLREFLFVSLYLPTPVFHIMRHKHALLSTIFNSDDFYRFHEDNVGARIGMNILGVSFHLDFDDKDTDRILVNVQSALA